MGLTINPNERKKKLYEKALAKPEAKRTFMDRLYIMQYGRDVAVRQGYLSPTALVREYTDVHRMNEDILRLSFDGWVVQSQSSFTPKKGAMRWILGGFAFFNRKPVTRVIFTRQLMETSGHGWKY